MEIAMFVWEFQPRIVGGLGTYASEIAPQYVKMGHDVTVFTLNGGKIPERDVWSGVEVYRPHTVDILNALPAFVIEDIRKRGADLKFFSDIYAYNALSAYKLVYELVKKEQRSFNIIVAHDWLSVMGGVTAKRELKKPFVFHLHSTEKGRNLGAGSQILRDLEREGGQAADSIVTVSSAMRDELIGLGFDEGKIQVCANGIDIQKYDPERVSKEDVEKTRQRYGMKPDEPMILFIGRLIPIKGVDKLILAMPKILQEYPKAKLVVVGIGDLQSHLTSLVKSLKIQDSVKFRFEFIPEEERILHYAACNLAVFPSLYEPFGIVCLEAMSMSKPVVVGAAGTTGMKDIVISNGPQQCGFHVNQFEPRDIAWGVSCALSDSDASRRFGENARRRVVEHYTWEKAAKNTIQVYENVLKNR